MRTNSRRMIALVAACAGLTTAAIAHGEDLKQVYQRSIDADARFLAARYAYESVSENTKIARARLLPYLRGGYEFTDTTQDIKNSDNEVFEQGDQDFDTDFYEVRLTQPLFRFGDWARLKQAKAEVAQGLVEFTAAEQDLILRVSELYLGVLAATDNLEYSTAEKQAVKRQLDLVTARRESGLATRTDLFDAQARYKLTVANEIAAMNTLEDAHQALQESTGVFITDLALLDEEIPLNYPEPQDIKAWVASAHENNLELQARNLGVQIADQEMRRRRAGHYPTLDFVAGFENRDSDGSLFGGGSEVEQTEFGVRLDLPIYQGGAVSSSVRQAAADLGQAKEERTAQARLVEREVRAAYLGVLSGISRVEALIESVIAQTSALEAKQKGNLAGINTTLDVLDAERDLYFIKRDFAQARYDYLLSTLRLKRANGTLSRLDLDEVNAMLAAQ